MTERWRSELTKLRSADFGGDLWDRVLEGPRLQTVTRPRSNRALTSVVAVAVFACVAVAVWVALSPLQPAPVTLPGSDRLEIPPRGETAAAFLADGHPVFVVHDADGTIAVLDALSPRNDFGISQLVAWCSTKPYFFTWPDPAFFDRNGGWTGGRAAAPGIGAYTVTVLDRDANGDPTRVRVGALGPPNAGGHLSLSSVGVHAGACGLEGGSTGAIVRHVIDPTTVVPDAADAVRVADGRWVAVRGALSVGGDGSVRLCDDAKATCSDGARVDGVDATALATSIASGDAGAFTGVHVWVAEVEHGTFVQLAPADDWS